MLAVSPTLFSSEEEFRAQVTQYAQAVRNARPVEGGAGARMPFDRSLAELFPDFKEKGAPLGVPVTGDDVYFFLSPDSAFKMPNVFVPKTMHNHGNYILSLGKLVRWLGKQAEALGVEIYPGFAAAEVLYDESGRVRGVLGRLSHGFGILCDVLRLGRDLG